MTLSNQLTDYIRGERFEDLNHTVFPGREWEEVYAEICALATDAVPFVNEVIERYIDTLYIPTFEENYSQDIVPGDLAMRIAEILDTLLPDWNIVQKSVFYWHYLLAARKTAHDYYMGKMYTKHNDKLKAEGKLPETGFGNPTNN